LLYNDIGFQVLALVVHGAPQVMMLAIDLHEHLVDVPAPTPDPKIGR